MAVLMLLGLPGSGKSTLARGLLDWLGWTRSFRIGTYHKREPESSEGESAAWAAMRADMESAGWDRFIIEAAGLSPRWAEVARSIPAGNLIRIKLVCPLEVLRARNLAKSPDDFTHGEWFPRPTYRDKNDFVTGEFAAFTSLPADRIVETGAVSSEEVLSRVRAALRETLRSNTGD